ncbi:hypothetical protein N836_31770 [Leptolyngbya sp. Heron Island J]|uniref:hypothetical protein n=1 Tax=Leptolyngbya sp. Heron Island J TaxID=1385935 RepID=UPI0003B94425|nr:hypothetical protein [Leptolyngbya sp. Heron Island J]ESA38520.1 hypothetical protein N836_31770 [Leptolyngbya sp. Heron Island J]
MTATLTTDTASGQFVHLELEEKVELKYSRAPVTLSMHELIRDWSEGLINDDAYIRFALKIERVGQEGLEEFDVTKFCEDWEGYTNSDKPKRLKEAKVTGYIQKLQQKGAATVEIKMQLSLDI